MEEAKRKEIIALHRAQLDKKLIATITGSSLMNVYRVIKKFEETGVITRKIRTDVHNKKRTKNFLQRLERRIDKEPTKSIRKQARDMGVNEKTMRVALKDLGMASRVRPKCQLFNDQIKKLRFERSQQLLNQLKRSRGTVKIFSDEKLFTVDQVHNRRNDRVIVRAGQQSQPVCKTKHPAGVMVLGIIASDGNKCPPIFVPSGLKVTSDAYIELLQKFVLPWLKKNYPHGNFVFQQDGAPAHTSNKTQKWLQDQNIPFWRKNMWPPSSPDLNPLNYSVWSVVEADACRKPHTSVATPKSSIQRAWGSMTSDYLISTCQAFRGRLEKVIENSGGLIE